MRDASHGTNDSPLVLPKGYEPYHICVTSMPDGTQGVVGGTQLPGIMVGHLPAVELTKGGWARVSKIHSTSTQAQAVVELLKIKKKKNESHV